MFRSALWTLRQPRYAKLAVLMFVVALICVGAGTWQISRFTQSVRDNDALDANARAAVTPLTTTLVPLVGHGPTPGRDAIRFRTVAAAGTYLVGNQQFLRDQSLGGASGYYVLTPVRTATGVLLVVRGFVADSGTGTPPATVEAPPAGLVHITGRLQTATTASDAAGGSTAEIGSINPAEQAARLGAPVYDAYLTLDAGQPGTAGVRVLPKPDLSNPAGGAYEAQHFAYIIQWYLFALLALAAPFVMSRHELREARKRYLGIDTGDEEFGLEPGGEGDQRLQLPAGTPAQGVVATRADGTLVRGGGPSPEQWQRAARLADRYGRALSIDPVEAAGQAGQPPAPNRTGKVPAADHGLSRWFRSRATGVHRSHDPYHGSYNDYLWELGLADGATPDVPVPPPPPVRSAPRNVTVEPDERTPSADRSSPGDER